MACPYCGGTGTAPDGWPPTSCEHCARSHRLSRADGIIVFLLLTQLAIGWALFAFKA